MSVTSSDENSIQAGALVGDNWGTITGVWVTGTVVGSTSKNGTAWVYVGGLVGRNNTGGSGSTAYHGTIRGSYSYAAVTASGRSNTPNVTGGTEACAGGIVARNKGTVSASFATGLVRASRVAGAGHHPFKGVAGGLAGCNTGTIIAGYATGNPHADAHQEGHAGGLVGYHQGGSITASYSTGQASVSSGTPDTYVGGLTGSSGGTVTNSYWDTTTSSHSTSAGGTGKTTSELQSPTGYTGIYANWDVNVDGVTGNDDPWDFGTSSEYPGLEYGTYLP